VNLTQTAWALAVGLVLIFVVAIAGCGAPPAQALDAGELASGAAALDPGLLAAHAAPSRGVPASVDAARSSVADTSPLEADHDAASVRDAADAGTPTTDAAPPIPIGCVAGGLYPDPVLGLTPCPPGSP
jgi:hypothetical protein